MQKENRIRDKSHLAYVRTQPCLIMQGGLNCNRAADPHHLLNVQEAAVGLKAGDNWTVPICRIHHRELHDFPMGEIAYFAEWGIDYEEVKSMAKVLWEKE